MSKVDVLRAIEMAFVNPRRLVEAISGADDDEQAVDALCQEFKFTRQAAQVVMDQQVRLLIRNHGAAIHEALLAAEDEAAGPPPR
jgi:DNA gyrase/topoisomerase IV subunit A